MRRHAVLLETAAPAIEQKITELTENRDAPSLAVTRVLREKAEFVERHRRRLARDAEKVRRKAVDRYRLVDELEQARTDALEARRAEPWAALYSDPLAIAEPGLSGDLLFGGQVRAEIPESRAQIYERSVLAMFRVDADWIDNAASGEQRSAIEGVDARPDPNTGWLEDPEFAARRHKQSQDVGEEACLRGSPRRMEVRLKACADCGRECRHVARGGRCGRCSWIEARRLQVERRELVLARLQWRRLLPKTSF